MKISVGLLVVALVAVMGIGVGFGAFTPVPDQSIDNLIGVSTSGSETGIYEIVANTATGLLVALGVVISFAGFRLVRRLIMTAGRG